MAITFSDYTVRRGDPANGDSLYTAPAGSNRILFFLVTGRGDQSTANRLTGISYGAQAATQLISPALYLNNYKATLYSLWYIKEADIPAGANNITMTPLANGRPVICFAAFGADQGINPDYNLLTHANNGGGESTLTHNFGANSGKTAIAWVITNPSDNSGGDFNFSHTGGTSLYALVNPHAHGLGWLSEQVTTKQSAYHFNPLLNDSTSVTTTITYPNDDTDTTGNKAAVSIAILLSEVSNTALTIDQAVIVPGGTISGSYSGFTPGTAPTSPLVLTDGTNSLDVTITIDDSAGDGTGTFTGTVPNLPSAGSSGNFLLFGNVTATLDDA